MKRFIAITGMAVMMLSVSAFGAEASNNTDCTNNGWVFTYTGNDDYFGKFLMDGWNKYVESKKDSCEDTTIKNPCEIIITTQATTEKPVETTSVEATTEKPVETTTVEATTEKPVETTTVQATTERPTEATTVQATTERPTEATTQTTTQRPTETTTQSSSQSSKTMEQQVVDLVNKHRAENGLSSLKISSDISKVAQAKSEDMRDKNYFDHTSPTYGSPFNMLKSFGISYKTAGENIAKGQRTAEAVVNAWMNSEGHRKNILNPNFKEIGVGYATGNGTTYWTQLFVTR